MRILREGSRGPAVQLLQLALNRAEMGALFADRSGYAAEETPYAAGFAGYRDWFIQDYRRSGFTLELGRGVNPLPIADFDAIYEHVRGILVLGALVT